MSQFGTGVVEFWNVQRTPFLTQSIECKNVVRSMDWDSDRQIFVVGDHRGVLHYWMGELWQPPQTLRLHQNTIYRLHLHPHHELVATSAWDAKDPVH